MWGDLCEGSQAMHLPTKLAENIAHISLPLECFGIKSGRQLGVLWLISVLSGPFTRAIFM